MARHRDLTRRQFVKKIACGIAAPAIAQATALGLGGRAEPADRITVGFIGTGKMANDYHLSTLLGFPDVQALAVCEVDRRRREHARQRIEQAYSAGTAYQGVAEYTDFRELIARRDLDAVCIAT